MAEQSEYRWRPIVKRRLAVATGLFVFWSVAIEARLVYLQVYQHAWLVEEAKDQQQEVVPLEPKRGDMTDRNGRLLAYNVDVDSIFAVPEKVEKPADLINKVCTVLPDCTRQERDTWMSRLTMRNSKGRLKQFVWLRRWITEGQAKRLTDLELAGVSLKRETRRFYPGRQLAAHLIGFVGDENTGKAGLESTFNSVIGGERGKAFFQVDRLGRPFSRIEEPPTPGASLELTIDEVVQHIVERELAAGVEWSGALGGSAIVMDSFSGEILALANVPTFNPNAYKSFSAEDRKNRAIQDVYEPGSTFKLVTAGAALEEKVLSPSDLIHTGPGVIRFGSRVIDEAKGHNYGTLTVEDVIVKSSNVGAVKIGLQVGRDRLSSYVGRFGFGARTSSDFRGESPGIVWRASDLDASAVASVSMGYQVSVTPMQMAAAVSAVANGGELVEPRLVRAITHNGVRKTFPRNVVRRVISPEVAKQLTAIMEGVVERGTAKTAQVEGFTIAGKTGTAAKAIPGGGYSSDYNVSFVGFVPSRDPIFTILVVIDSPRKVSAYGGTVAAPVFQKIAAATLRHRGVAPSINAPPPLLVARHDEHSSTSLGTGTKPVSGPAEPAIVALAANAAETDGVVPNLVGMNARDAARTLARLGLGSHLRGSGTVVNQRPAAGSPLDSTDVATLWLERRPRPENPVADAPPQALDAVGGVPRGRP